MTEAAPANRLEHLGHSSGRVRRKPEEGPKHLTARHLLLIQYLVEGCGHASILSKIKRNVTTLDENGHMVEKQVSPKPYEKLSLIEAADLLRIRRRNARELFTLPIFKTTYESELAAYRNAEKAASLRKIVDIRDDPGLGKAADRKVQMQAAQAILGEGEGNRSGVSVSVFAAGQQITAGVVIRVRDEHAVAGERTATIEHENSQ